MDTQGCHFPHAFPSGPRAESLVFNPSGEGPGFDALAERSLMEDAARATGASMAFCDDAAAACGWLEARGAGRLLVGARTGLVLFSDPADVGPCMAAVGGIRTLPLPPGREVGHG